MSSTPLRMSTAHHRAQVMKSLAPDQFEELIISHISRRIELNDGKLDELMNGVSKSKSSIASLTRASLKRITSPFQQSARSKGGSSEKDSTGLELSSRMVSALSKLIVSLSSAAELQVEGLFRKSGNCSRVKELKQKLMEDCSVDLSPYTSHDRAAVVKNLLRDMSEPLLLAKHFEAFRQAVVLGTNGVETAKQRCLKVMQLLMLHLPRNNLLMVRRLLGLLSSVAAEPANKMDSASLATLFVPHLLCSKQLQSDAALFNSALTPATAAVEFMIENYSRLFQIPTDFVRDVNRFLQSESDRPPDKVVTGICSPISTVSENGGTPVRTPQMSSADSVSSKSGKSVTEVELAKLQAHILSLPGCQKRKLPKPLNVMTAMRSAMSADTPSPKYADTPRKHFRSKSLGSSIRKRLPIFKNKNKTPAAFLDLGGSFTAVNIDLENTPSDKALIVDCQPSKNPPSDNDDDDEEEDVTPPKVARHLEPKAAPISASQPKGRSRDAGTKDSKENSPLPSTENEREYLSVPGSRGRVLSQVQCSPTSDNVPSGAQETPQRCRGRSRERRLVRSSAVSSPLSVETSL